MKWPPMLLHLTHAGRNGTCGFWLPWFLIYILLLLLLLIALPFVLITLLVLVPLGRSRPLIMAGPYLWNILVATRGLIINFTGNHGRLTLDLI